MAAYSKIIDNAGYGILVLRSIVYAEDCYIMRNGKNQICTAGKSGLMLAFCDVRGNGYDTLNDEGDNKLKDTTNKNCLSLDVASLVQIKHCTGDSKFLDETSKFSSWKIQKSVKKQRVSFSGSDGKAGSSKNPNSTNGEKLEPGLQPTDNLPALENVNVTTPATLGDLTFVPLSTEIGLGTDMNVGGMMPIHNVLPSVSVSQVNALQFATAPDMDPSVTDSNDLNVSNMASTEDPMEITQASYEHSNAVSATASLLTNAHVSHSNDLNTTLLPEEHLSAYVADANTAVPPSSPTMGEERVVSSMDIC